MEDGKTTKAIDEDAKIVYIDADNQTKGDDGMGITSICTVPPDMPTL